MDQEGKAAYYYSELGRREAASQDNNRSNEQIDHNQSKEMNRLESNNPSMGLTEHDGSFLPSDKPTIATTTTTQPQYLITSSNPQHLTNLTPQQQQQLAHQYNQSTFQNRLLSNNHSNPNQLYHAGLANNNPAIIHQQFHYQPQIPSTIEQPQQTQIQNQNIAGIERSQDDTNIYEDIDNVTLAHLRASLQHNNYGDTMSLRSEKKNAKWIGSSFTRWFSTRKKASDNSHSSDMEDNPYNDNRLSIKLKTISMPKIGEEQLKNYPTDRFKRRLIVQSIVDSENSYLNSLHRLINDYKKPLEEANPSILSANKIEIIFFNLERIFQLHNYIFSLKLNMAIQDWDEKERIGDTFASTFSNPLVLDIYSNFINNFTNAMETARKASKSKAFAMFLKDRTLSSPDRLNLFGSMVKPVQRFPQFIVFLNELLKHTPYDHVDRMSLQKALTELESLADKLNERKRDSERHFAVKQLLKDYLNDTNSHSRRILLRQDDVCLLDTKTKNRKLYLLNDMLICISIPLNRLKFAVSLCDIDAFEDKAPGPNDLYSIERIECDRQSLVHDMDLMTKVSSLVASLKFQYNGLPPTLPDQIMTGIREEIRMKEFQMTMIDRSCLQLQIKAKNQKETVCVQFKNPENKQDWLTDLRLTKLALDTNNNPGWKNINQTSDSFRHNRAPLFVKSLAVFGTSKQSQLTCALHYPAGVLWICNVNNEASSLGALATHGSELSLIHSYELSDSHVTCLESVGSTLWIGLRQGRIIVIDANSPVEWVQFNSLVVHHEVTCIRYFGNLVYVGLINGDVAIYDAVNFGEPLLITLSKSPVTCLVPINNRIFACSHNKVWIIEAFEVVENFSMQSESDEIITTLEEEPCPNLMAHCGSGLWVSLINSPVVKLYHAETLKHIHDINIGDSIRKILTDATDELKITVTSILATRGLLWIGTNIGIVATLMLPRLQGVPVVSGGIDIALHKFLGPVNLLLNLSPGPDYLPQLPINASNSQVDSLYTTNIEKNEEMQIYGQYADLMNINDYISGRSSKPVSADVAWDFTKNMSSMNISEDSISTASSPMHKQNQNAMSVIPQESNQIPQMHYDTRQTSPSVRIYDRPQLQQQLMQATGSINSTSRNLYNHSNYSSVGKNSANKTALVLAGGNGYQRLVYGDTFSQNAAHCIIWEYKL